MRWTSGSCANNLLSKFADPDLSAVF